jgi:hypothetical protein
MAMPSTTIHFRPVEQAFILYIDLKNGIRVDGKGLCSVLKERNEHPREFNTALKFFRRALQVMREMNAKMFGTHVVHDDATLELINMFDFYCYFKLQ